jgi:UDP-glucose 4-epimerase
VIESVGRVAGRPVPYTMGPRRAGDPAVLYASSARIKRDLGWQPRFEEIDTIVKTAWRWRESHPRGYDDRAAR